MDAARRAAALVGPSAAAKTSFPGPERARKSFRKVYWFDETLTNKL